MTALLTFHPRRIAASQPGERSPSRKTGRRKEHQAGPAEGLTFGLPIPADRSTLPQVRRSPQADGLFDGRGLSLAEARETGAAGLQNLFLKAVAQPV